MRKSKLLFALFVAVAIAYAIRISFHLADHYALDSWVLLTLSVNAGVFFERWRRPEEDATTEPPETSSPVA